jgi:hypothetical protein
MVNLSIFCFVPSAASAVSRLSQQAKDHDGGEPPRNRRSSRRLERARSLSDEPLDRNAGKGTLSRVLDAHQFIDPSMASLAF